MPTITNKNHFVIDIPNLGGGRNTKDADALIDERQSLDTKIITIKRRI